jgi:hypothetical protein
MKSLSPKKGCLGEPRLVGAQNSLLASGNEEFLIRILK